MRCDLHVHSIHSGMCDLPVMNTLCRESYSPPEAIYERLKLLGMDLVTITDHDSIDGCERLLRHSDFFISEEVTCFMPSGTELHVGVYDISEAQHVGIQRRSEDLPRLVAYLEEQRIFFCLNHAFSGLTGHRTRDDFEEFKSLFPAMETLNGAIPEANNRAASRFAERHRKATIGGSDAHTIASLGSAYTRVPGARSKNEFLAGLFLGRGVVSGSSGNYWRLTRDVLLITAAMIAEQPGKLFLAPAALGIPAVTMALGIHEEIFARRWRRRLTGEAGLVKGSRPRRRRSGAEEALA